MKKQFFIKLLYKLYLVRLILLILLFTSACSPDIDEFEIVTDIYFQKRPPPVSRYDRSNYGPEALIHGKLELKNSCIGFKGTNGVFITLINWPRNFDLMKRDGVVHIMRNGKSIAAIGDYVGIGGSSLRSLVIPLKTHCQEPYWRIGEFKGTSFFDSIYYRYRHL